MLEVRNRIVGFRGLHRNQRFEQSEIARLQQLLGSRPRARVLVVIPTYKRPEVVRRAVASALAQSYRDLMVVVVADGAGLPDFSSDPRLVAVSLSRNSANPGLVRNVGIALADSEYIAFLDDDNVWAPDHVDTVVDALDADPTLAGVYTSARRIRPDGSQFDVLGQPFDRLKLRASSYIDTNCIAVRRSFYRGFSVLPRTRHTHPEEDWEFVWRLSGRGKLVYIPKITVDYAINPQSYFTEWGSATDPVSPDIESPETH